MHHWYVIQVMSSHEKKVQRILTENLESGGLVNANVFEYDVAGVFGCIELHKVISTVLCVFFSLLFCVRSR